MHSANDDVSPPTPEPITFEINLVLEINKNKTKNIPITFCDYVHDNDSR